MMNRLIRPMTIEDEQGDSVSMSLLLARGAFWYNGSEGCLHVGDIST